jgi:hypothetical protein
MVRRNINVAMRYHEFVIIVNVERFARRASLVLHSAAQPHKPLSAPWPARHVVGDLSPPAFPTIPGEQQIGKPIINDTHNRPDDWQAEQSPKPDVARCSEPNRDRAVNSRVKSVLSVDSMQPAPHVVYSDTEGGEHIRLKIDIAKIDCFGSDRANKPTALPVDASITYGTFSVVPDREFRDHRTFKTCRASGF